MGIGETELREFLVRRLAQYCELTPAEVDPNRLLLEYGLTSRDAIAVTGELEDLLDRPLQPTSLWRYPTLNQMVRGLLTEAQEIAIIGTAQGLAGETEEIEWEALERAGIAPSLVDRNRLAEFAESSLVAAAHQAMESLRADVSDLALAVGADRGGRAAVVLKRFPDAERDGDRIVAVLNDNAMPAEIENAKPTRDFDALLNAALANTTISDGSHHLVVRRIRQPLAESPLQGVGHFVLSDISIDRIRAYAGALANHLRVADAGLADIAYTLARRLGRGPIRAAVVARDRQELIAGLTALADDRPHPAVATGQATDPPPAPVWVFPAHSPTWQDIQPLAEAEPDFAATLDQLDKLLLWATGSSIHDTAGESTPAERFGIQVALGLLWRQHGVVPVAVVGIDEVAAQVVAGVLSATDGALVIAGRGPAKAGEPRIPFYSSVEEAAKDGHRAFTEISLDPANPVIDFHRQLANLEVQGHPVEQSAGRVIDLPVPVWR